METAKSLGQITFVSAADSLPLVSGVYIVVTERPYRGDSPETFETVWLASWDEECGEWFADKFSEDRPLPYKVVRWALFQAYGQGL
jgi:hypothetical protein